MLVVQNRLRAIVLSSGMLCSFWTNPLFAQEAKPDRAALEKAFAEKMTNCELVGSFTLTGQDPDKAPKADRYEIVKATKRTDDLWIFESKLKIGGKETIVPLAINVYWADDTPMMSLSKFTIPGMGTYSARILFHGDRYAGTWQHDEKGGHMWGAIRRKAAE